MARSGKTLGRKASAGLGAGPRARLGWDVLAVSQRPANDLAAHLIVARQ